MPQPSRPASRVPAVQRAAAILSAVASSAQPTTLAALARTIDAPKSSVLGVCQGLVSNRLLTRGRDGSYWLGPRVVELAAARRTHTPVIRHIGMSLQSSEDAFFVTEIEASREEARALGATITAVSAEQDITRQSDQLDAFIEAGVDLIIVDPVAADGLEAAALRARARGIPVIAINGAVAGADASVTTDNTQAGVLAGHYLAQLLSGQGSVAIIDGTSVTAVTDRVAGFLDALRDHPEVKVVAHVHGNNTRECGVRTARAVLGSHRVDAFFAINDPTAVGVAEACVHVGRSVPVLSVDGSAAAVEQIRRGGPIAATAAQDPARLARSGIRLGVALRSGVRPPQQTLLLPTRLITRSNVEDFVPWK
jgi:ribose transport system substrate-binding protein